MQGNSKILKRQEDSMLSTMDRIELIMIAKGMDLGDLISGFERETNRKLSAKQMLELMEVKKPSLKNLAILARVLDVSSAEIYPGRATAAMADAGLSTKEIAIRLGKSRDSFRNFVRRIDKGEGVNSRTLKRFSRIVKVSPAWMLGE